jgi:PTH2 family peptidyl-tRNA hydrolase
MGKGKIAAQCAHAAVGVVDEHREFSNGEFEAWELKGHAKVALRVANDTDMVNLHPSLKFENIRSAARWCACMC